MLNVSNLNVAYGHLRVLSEINVTADREKIISIIGANGAGKTTLLKTASGLIRAKSGTISFEGQSIHDKAPHQIVRLGVVLIPEGRKLFTSLTVEDNLRVGSYLREARKVRQETMDRIFTMFPRLKERRKQFSGTLSGGEQQMLAIARGLMSRPKLLMLDEPSLGLAPLIVSHIFSVIQEIKEQRVTVLLVEQNVAHALKMSHWGYIIENGRIVLSGTGEELAGKEHTKKAYFGEH